MTPPTTTVTRFPSHRVSRWTVPAQAPTTKGRAYAPSRNAASQPRLRTSLRSIDQRLIALRVAKGRERSRDSRPAHRCAGPAQALPLDPVRHRQLGLRLRPLVGPHDLALAPEDLEGQAIARVHAL